MDANDLLLLAEAIAYEQLQLIKRNTLKERERKPDKTGKIVGIENGLVYVRDSLGNTSVGQLTAGRGRLEQVVAIAAEGRFDPL